MGKTLRPWSPTANLALPGILLKLTSGQVLNANQLKTYNFSTGNHIYWNQNTGSDKMSGRRHNTLTITENNVILNKAIDVRIK